MPDIKKIAVEIVPEGKLVTVTALIQSRAEVEADDVAKLVDIIHEAGTINVQAAGQAYVRNIADAPAEASTGRRRRGAEAPAEAPAEEAPATGRRRRGAEAQAEEAKEEAPAGRRRRGAEPAEEPKQEAPAEGRRRRGAEAPAKPMISDGELTKLCTEALRKLIAEGEVKTNAEKFLLDIIGEFKTKDGDPCDNVSDIQADDRPAFVAELKKEGLA
jgi:hypothetical protein